MTLGLQRVHRLLEQLLVEIEVGARRRELNSVWFRPTARVTVDGQLENHPRIHVSYLRTVSYHLIGKPILFLDATASPLLNRLIFERPIRTRVFDCERKGRIIQVTRKTFSRQSLTGLGSNCQPVSAGLDRQAKLLREQIGRLAQNVADDHGSVAVFCNKQAEEQIQPNLPKDALTGHFGALRGMNRYEHCVAAIVIGREQPSVQDLERQARAFAAKLKRPFRSLVCIDGNAQYIRVPRPHRMRDGRLEFDLVDIHRDPIVNEVLDLIREAELVQAIDRVRAVRNFRVIYILTNIPLAKFGIVVDELVRWLSLVPKRSRLKKVYEEFGMLPLSAPDLYRIAPHEFSSLDSAKGYLKRHAISGSESQIKLLFGKVTPKSACLFQYKHSGRGVRWRPAIVDRERHSDPSQALSQALGREVGVRDNLDRYAPRTRRGFLSNSRKPSRPSVRTIKRREKTAASHRQLLARIREMEVDWSRVP